MPAISLGYSPCPNDTLIFDAIVNHKIDLEGLEFEVVLGDVEALNQMAFAQQLEVTKLSYHAWGHLLPYYALLRSGSALGRNCGPLVIAKTALADNSLASHSIALPGKFTTAHFLFSMAYPEALNKSFVLFSDIEQLVQSGQHDAGVIIHENRFTYAEKGLHKITDLGQVWESNTGFPIPLGGIFVKRRFDAELKSKINRVLRRSIEYAFAHPEETLPYVRCHAQEMSEAVMMSHIKLYVNDFSIDLGQEGLQAVDFLLHRAAALQLIPANPVYEVIE